MRVVIERDGTMEIRANSPVDNYALRKWYEDWKAGNVCLRVSYLDDAGAFTKDEVRTR